MHTLQNPLLHSNNKVTEDYYAEKFQKNQLLMHDMTDDAIQNSGDVFYDPVGFCQKWEERRNKEKKSAADVA